MSAVDQLLQRIGDIPTLTKAEVVLLKSRDYYWYSPILKSRLDHVIADAVVMPRSEAEVVSTLQHCFELGIPVTPRGRGTGNYAQAMPLAGGIVLDLTRFNRILDIRDGAVTAEPGALLGAINNATRKQIGQELRMLPSTYRTATIAGFISGGSGGIGSIRWGMLQEPGNILRLRIATMEAEPRLLELQGEDINQVHHAYGVTGIITEAEMPLAPAPDWVDMLVAFRDWGDCLEAGRSIAGADDLWLKETAAVQAPAPERYFHRFAPFIESGDHLLVIMAAPESMSRLVDLAAGAGGRIAYRSDEPGDADTSGLHVDHLVWNHTTLRGMKTDPDLTYLQVGFPEGREIESCLEIARRYPDEIINHIEYTRGNGQLRMSCLPMVRFHSEARLIDMMLELEALGCPVWNPHAYTLEEGNRRDPDPQQIACKQENDPGGLLNPGKMIGWENPEYSYDARGGYVYSGLQEAKP